MTALPAAILAAIFPGGAPTIKLNPQQEERDRRLKRLLNDLDIAYLAKNKAYTLSGGAVTQNNVILTDPAVNVTSLEFYVSGTTPGDAYQPHVTITISGTVSSGQGKTEPFSVETGATMRGIDL